MLESDVLPGAKLAQMSVRLSRFYVCTLHARPHIAPVMLIYKSSNPLRITLKSYPRNASSTMITPKTYQFLVGVFASLGSFNYG